MRVPRPGGPDLARRRTAAYLRQGEWFFMPRPTMLADPRMVLRNEPLSRAMRSKPHIVDLAFRRGGESVMVCSARPNGVSPEQYRMLIKTRPKAALWNWRTARVNATVYVKGRVRHPDHATLHVDRVLLPIINRMGVNVTARLERYGFYPAGGGRVVVDVAPATQQRSLAPIELVTRGKTLKQRACVVHAQLPPTIAERELEIIRRRLGWDAGPREVCRPQPCIGPGNAVLLEVVSEGITEVFGVMGEPGKAAERVAEEAVELVRDYIRTDAPVGPYLADQLMVYMALAGDGVMATGALSGHSTTNIETIAMFLARPRVSGGGGKGGVERWEWRPR